MTFVNGRPSSTDWIGVAAVGIGLTILFATLAGWLL